MEKLFETIALSVITVLLLLLMLTRKSGKIKLILGSLTAVSSIASMVFFILMQKAAGNPDAGKEMMQLYVPCAAYLIVAAIGLVAVALSRRKLRMDKAAKIVAKNKNVTPPKKESQS